MSMLLPPGLVPLLTLGIVLVLDLHATMAKPRCRMHDYRRASCAESRSCVQSPKLIIPAVATDDSSLVIVLACLASNVQQALRPFIAILIHMEVKVQVTLFGQGEHSATTLSYVWTVDSMSKG